MSDDLDASLLETFEQIPPGLGRFDLLRRMFTAMFAIGAEDPWVSSVERGALIRTEPMLRMAHQVEMDRVITQTREFIADYLGCSPDDFALRVFVFAVSGSMAHIVESSAAPDDDTRDQFLAAIDLLEQGLPISQ